LARGERRIMETDHQQGVIHVAFLLPIGVRDEVIAEARRLGLTNAAMMREAVTHALTERGRWLPEYPSQLVDGAAISPRAVGAKRKTWGTALPAPLVCELRRHADTNMMPLSQLLRHILILWMAENADRHRQ